MRIDDMYSLEKWLKQKALEAHNAKLSLGCRDCQFRCKCDSCTDDGCVAPAYEDAYNKVLTYIDHGRKNQRPHVQVRI